MPAADAYPALTDPAALLREVAAAVGGTRTGSTDDAFTWQGIIHEGLPFRFCEAEVVQLRSCS